MKGILRKSVYNQFEIFSYDMSNNILLKSDARFKFQCQERTRKYNFCW